MLIIPAIDVKDGRCVRLVRGDFDTAHEVAEDSVAVAGEYRRAGAALIHVVDLDGAKDGAGRNASLIRDIVRAAMPARVELGGGLRRMEDLEAADAMGIERFVIGSAAVTDPDFVRAAVTRFGERVAVGVDARNGLVRTEGWTFGTKKGAAALVREMEALGVGTIIFTDIDKDGALSGPNLDDLRGLRTVVKGRLIASGGVSEMEDIRALCGMGVDGAIVGKALYAGRLDLAGCIQMAKIWAGA